MRLNRFQMLQHSDAPSRRSPHKNTIIGAIGALSFEGAVDLKLFRNCFTCSQTGVPIQSAAMQPDSSVSTSTTARVLPDVISFAGIRPFNAITSEEPKKSVP
jgi:hypothetical protein